MYSNPFALKPGEKLTPQQLFERYLDWSNHSQYVSRIWKRGPLCDEDLKLSNLCCTDHMNFSSEYETFFRYFSHLRMTSYEDSGFSVVSMVDMIHKFNLKIDDRVAEKLKRFHGTFAELFFETLRNK